MCGGQGCGFSLEIETLITIPAPLGKVNALMEQLWFAADEYTARALLEDWQA